MKRYRYNKIKEIVQSKAIETQEELAAALLEEGIEVTQATVSRDIKELMLIKIPTGDGHYRYALSPEENVACVTSIPSSNKAAASSSCVSIALDCTISLILL